MRRVFGWVVGAVVLLGGGRLDAQARQAFQVGTIDFFGGQGMDTAALLPKLPVRVGQPVKMEQVEQLQPAISAAVLTATGKATTDVNVVCCDQPGKVQLYVGLQGGSYRAASYAAAPTGDATLPEDGVVLYRNISKANEQAVESGHAQEDDSNGYALSSVPAMHAIEVKMRAYALKHAGAIEDVLRGSKDAEERQAAAMLLGYAERSDEQVKDLALAAGDANSDVRNNAVRALVVLAAAQPLVGLEVKPFVGMLYSGSWTDRNKASFLLFRITQARDPAVLKTLRDEAMGPLRDGARWQSAGHAFPFLMILGRIGGIDEVRLQKLIDSGARDEIIAAAEKH